MNKFRFIAVIEHPPDYRPNPFLEWLSIRSQRLYRSPTGRWLISTSCEYSHEETEREFFNWAADPNVAALFLPRPDIQPPSEVETVLAPYDATFDTPDGQRIDAGPPEGESSAETHWMQLGQSPHDRAEALSKRVDLNKCRCVQHFDYPPGYRPPIWNECHSIRSKRLYRTPGGKWFIVTAWANSHNETEGEFAGWATDGDIDKLFHGRLDIDPPPEVEPILARFDATYTEPPDFGNVFDAPEEPPAPPKSADSTQRLPNSRPTPEGEPSDSPKVDVTSTTATVDTPAPCCPVELRGESMPPRIRGREAKRLPQGQYNVVQALVEAWPASLSKDKLIDRSGHGDAVNMLKTVVGKSPDWKSVIILPGSVGRGTGYKIAPE